MFCKNCGREINGDVKFCPNCGAPVDDFQPIPQQEEPHYYKAEVPGAEYGVEKELNPTLWIILGAISTFFCCLIGGIVTIVYAAKAKGYYDSGDYFNAENNLSTAKKWFIASVVIGVLSSIFQIMMMATANFY